VVWAVKPQTFKEAATGNRPFLTGALHLSVAAGITSDSMARWLDSERIVRAMPNTPALVGLGMTGLFARPGASQADRALVETVVRTTGELVWVSSRARPGCGHRHFRLRPGLCVLFSRSHARRRSAHGAAGRDSAETGHGNLCGRVDAGAALDDPPQTLRERVTSKGGTTHAAITSMESAGMKSSFEQALAAAQKRAEELGREFGG
jgi:pyrroline-5-carboxylate reductase